MAIIANTVVTSNIPTVREQLPDVIWSTSPLATPFVTMCKKGKATSRNPEWMRDRVRDPNPANAVIEGDDNRPAANVGQPDRLKNYTQIFDETVIVSDTSRAVDTAGRRDELLYQVAKAGEAIKLDIEQRLTSNFGSVLGNSTTAGQAAGAESWITTNTVRGVGGADGGYNTGTGLVTAATDGTLRPFTEILLKDAVEQAWRNSGDTCELIMVSGKNKQQFANFTGIAQQTNEISNKNQTTIIGSVDVYRSDFNKHRVVPNRYMGAGAGRVSIGNNLFAGQTALLLTAKTWEIMTLQPFKVETLARTGHAEKRLLKTELTLCCKEERANALVADLQ